MCTHLGTSKLSFTYGSAPDLSAHIFSPPDSDVPNRLKLLPVDGNPHSRIRALLERELHRSPLDQAFDTLTFHLTFTLSLLEAFDRLQAVDFPHHNVTIHPYSPLHFRLIYAAPLPAVTFNIIAKKPAPGPASVPRWYIKPILSGPPLPDTFHTVLGQAWTGGGDDWRGLVTGIEAGPGSIGPVIEAGPRGIGPVIDKLDAIMRSFAPMPVHEVPKPHASVARASEFLPIAPPHPASGKVQHARPPSQQHDAAPSSATGPDAPDVIMLD